MICTRKSNSNKESQPGVESKSTEVMNSKMQRIRFALSVNVIQMRRNRGAAIRREGEAEEWESKNQTRPAPHRNKFPDGWKGS
jgi:hypothetical protein